MGHSKQLPPFMQPGKEGQFLCDFHYPLPEHGEFTQMPHQAKDTIWSTSKSPNKPLLVTYLVIPWNCHRGKNNPCYKKNKMHLSGNPLTKTLKVFCLKSLKILINQLGGWGWGSQAIIGYLKCLNLNCTTFFKRYSLFLHKRLKSLFLYVNPNYGNIKRTLIFKIGTLKTHPFEFRNIHIQRQL